MSAEPDELTKAVGEALAAECMAIFGSTWSNDTRWRLAAAALRSVEDEVPKLRGIINGAYYVCDGYCHENCG